MRILRASRVPNSRRVVCCATVLRMALTFSLAMVQVTLAMAQGRADRDVLYHPTPENTPEVTDPRFILKIKEGVELLPEADFTSVTIGVDDGEYDEMFGSLQELAIVGDGTFLTVDQANFEVRAYDYDGTLLGSFGKAGEGPGEFSSRGPERIEVTDDGNTACVLDYYFVNCFERVGKGQFVPKRKIPVQIWATDMCIMGGHIYMVGYQGYEPEEDRIGVIHKFDLEGNPVLSFGAPYKASHRYHVAQLSRRGTIACSEQHGLVGLIRMDMPILTAYTSNGEIAWRVKFDDVEPIKMRTGFSEGNPYYGFKRREPGESELDALFTDAAGDFYVHFSTFVAEAEDEPKKGPFFRIAGQTGEGEYLGGTERVVGITGDYVFTMRTHPFSQVQVHKRSQSSR